MARASMTADNDTGELDELWSVPPDKFVAARNAAVAALRASGDEEGAAQLKAVKRPSPSAWLVNALVRTSPKEVEAIFHAGDELMRAQGRVLGGAPPSEMHAAMRSVREAINRAMKRARAILAEHDRNPTAELTRRVTHTLRSASLDKRLRDVVRTARLTADPSVDEVEVLTDVRVPKTVARPTPAKKQRPSAKEKRAAVRERARAEREAERAREHEARERLRAEVAEASEAAQQARRTLSNAESEERRARAAAEEAAHEVVRARRALKTATEKLARTKKRAR